ncbi:neuropeptide CCHamide-1 [Drosophila sulfurigaster albostrigata]|uniref:neuropeptide CCHamide-1 n=1 Tax=Drosophila sulfurigaster albostrigata TaxID=89887 RepID=UPI002D21E024|nr:neuropeptide CCHamide-1 [Drosophila sulfurigaster albostrigata]
MWYNKFNWTILVFLVLFTLVTGSCLEYGHSCWGAHGKRSGNRPPIAIKQAPPYADNLAEQLMSSNDDESNNNNNVNNVNNNKLNDLPLTASALSLPSERGVAVGDGVVEGECVA